MSAIQLEFNLKDESDIDVKLSIMQKQIVAMEESMGKVRRKMFSQLGEMQKICLEVKNENEILKEALRKMKNEEIDWTFGKQGTLFDVYQCKQASG